MCQPTHQEDQQVNKLGNMKVQEELPTNPIAKAFVGIFRTVPTVNIPFTNVDIGFCLFAAAFLYCVRVSARLILVNFLDFPAGVFDTHETEGSITAAVHASLLVPGLFVALTSQPYRPTAHLNTAPQWWQDLVSSLLQLCTGYMIYDTFASYILYLGFSGIQGADWLFVGHHIATAVYMTQCRVLKAGHISAMICMFLGEFTNPFQNGHIVLGHALKYPCCNGALTQQLFHGVEFLFALFYFSIRAFIAPIFFAHVTYALLFESSRNNIPVALRIVWIIMIWAVEAGSYAWIVGCYELLQKYMGYASVSDGEL